MANMDSVVVACGQKVDLADISTKAPKDLDKEQSEKDLQELVAELGELEDLLYYAGKQSVLIVLQGMDTSGKDGTIRFLLDGFNGQSNRVASFKVPTPEELAHDFLWRVHQETPGKGELVIFNRSHYEDVLVVRVHDFVPREVWSKRYQHIRNFEQNLLDSNTIILKFFLHISKDEQEERLLAREQEVEKAWKLSAGDWKERQFWNDYQSAYADALSECGTKSAPWIVVPADQKWYRNLVVAQAVADALRPYKASWLASLEKVGNEAKAELAEYKASLTT
jgi:PPK2 family polyphosphate:nucleotide phosphotransferase